MKKKFKYELGSIVKYKLKKANVYIIARMEREHVCGVKDIQYIVRDSSFEAHEVGEDELSK